MRQLALTVTALLVATSLLATDLAYLVKDINQTPSSTAGSSYPDHFAVLGNLVYFNTTTYDAWPLELWRTDGTAAGTFFLSTGGFSKVAWNGRLWFLKNVPDSEIWSTDGSVAGTQSLSVPCAPATACIQRLYAGGNHLYYVNGGNLWRTDGTPETTAQVSTIDFTPAFEMGDVPSSTVVGQTLFFIANANDSGQALWKTSDAGTSIVKSLASSAPLDYFYAPVSAGSLVYMQEIEASSGLNRTVGLWRSDGTTAGTFMIKPCGDPAVGARMTPIVSGPYVYFVGNDGSGSKLWRTDGSLEGTVAVASSLPGASSTFSASPKGILGNGTLIFTGPGIGGPQGLWAFDGSQTTFLTNVSSGNPSRLASVAGSYAVIGIGSELWRTDGTISGTSLLGYYSGSDGYHNWPMAARDGEVIFGASAGGHGYEPWITGGSIASTRLLKDINMATYASYPKLFRPLRGGVVFTAALDQTDFPATANRELWFSQGTEATTTSLLSDVDTIYEIGICAQRAFFSRYTSETGTELWSTDGTAAGTSLVKDIYPGPNGGSPHLFTCMDDRLYFFAQSSYFSEAELWRSDGTAAGTLLVKTTAVLQSPGSNATKTPIYVLDHHLYFGLQGDSGQKLWRSDGTPAGTFVVKSLNGSVGKMIVTPQYLYFVTSGSDSSLWRSDGTAEGTVSFLTDQYFALHAPFNGKAVFQWHHNSQSVGLCLGDGFAATVCFDPGLSFNTSGDSTVQVLNGGLYYNVPDLRSSDGVTAASTGVGEFIKLLANAGGRLFGTRGGYFALSETDGTPSGTHVVFASNTWDVGASAGRLFIGSDELYAYDLPVAVTDMSPGSISAGGATITLTGRGFTSPATVLVGGVSASVSSTSSTSITFIAPSHDPGTYAVELTLGDGRRITVDEPLRYTCSPPVAVIDAIDQGAVAAETPVVLHGHGGTRCAWFPATGLNDPSSCTPTATPGISMTYTLIVFNASDCESTNHPSVRLRVIPAIPTGFVAFVDSSRHVQLTWSASSGALQYEIARLGVGEPLHVVASVSNGTSYNDAAVVASNAYLYRVRAVGTEGTSAYGAGDAVALVLFTDDFLFPNFFRIKRVHIMELRDAVERIRALTVLQAITWSEPIVTGSTPVRAEHFLEIRIAIADTFSALGLPVPAFTPNITPGNTVRVSDIVEIRRVLH